MYGEYYEDGENLGKVVEHSNAEQLASMGAHPDDGRRPTEQWDKGL